MNIVEEYKAGRHNFRGIDLRHAGLRHADLRGADLRGADLRGANLRGANLRGADLQSADLEGADLQSADLEGADLRGADLERADLRGADLRDANLERADLRDANLRGADLQGADLQSADLQSADLQGAILPPISILPQGDIIGWKKLGSGAIAELLIPANAARVNSTGRKCRAEFAKVLRLIGSSREYEVSSFDPDFVYRVGDTVRPDQYDPDFRVECSHGIHFFITRQEAEKY